MNRAFLILLVTLITGTCGGQEVTELFNKLLSDGRSVVVTKEMHQEYQEPTENEQETLPRGFIAVAGDFDVERLKMSIRDADKIEKIVWHKERKSLAVPSQKGLNIPFVIHDVVEMDSRLAILFSADSTDIEIIQRDENDKYFVASRSSLFQRSSQFSLSKAQLVWLGDLYALFAFAPSGVDIWQVSSNSSVKVFSSRN